MRPVGAIAMLGVALASVAGGARGDEGMWLVNDFPFARFERAHRFRPTQDFLDHLRLSTGRLSSGGSGAFVSSSGLLITNFHLASDCLQDLSTGERDLLKHGFVARTRAEELACPALELDVLKSIERVTPRVRAAEAGAAGDAGAAADARREVLAAVEKECADATGDRCDVVTLYAGGEYDLYRYQRYTDVRLAFAPEARLAQFGGDADNFEYPRYAIDVALLRAYENGRPASTPHFLSWSRGGVREGDVTFMIGNPGSTARLLTVAQLEWLRDCAYPTRLAALEAERRLLVDYAQRGAEAERIAKDETDSVENAIKAISGYQSGLLDPRLLAEKRASEAELRRAVAADAQLAARVGDPWGEIERAEQVHRTIYPRQTAIDGLAYASDLGGYARLLLRLATERPKPNGERLREFRETAMPALTQKIEASGAVYPDFDAFRLGAALRTLAVQLGPVHPLVRRALGKSTPEQVAEQAVAGTKLADPAVRKALAAGGQAAIDAARDPLIDLMAIFEPLARELRDISDRQVEGVEWLSGARVAEAYFAVRGRETYPDATFTPRITYGVVRGYEEDGESVPFFTRFSGLLLRSAQFRGRPPYDLPAGLGATRAHLDLNLEAPVDFVSTHDIIGGNSGSPVVDRAGDFVGIVFDGNLHNLPNRFRYSEEKARAISVDARAILTTLTDFYPARNLAQEIRAGQ
ncbi:MAG: S46 family peptidase [Thermoanaerobaculia bacterium]